MRLREFLGDFFRHSEEGGGTGMTEVDASSETRRIIGGKLFDGAMAEVSAAATARKLGEYMKANNEQRAEWLRTEQRLAAEVNSARQATSAEAGKSTHLDILLQEIVIALDSGRTLTGADIRVGRGNALNPNYNQKTFLPVPKPAATNTKAGGEAAAAPDTVEQPQA